MSVVAKGTAQIRHAGTGAVYEIQANELDWQEVAADERQMGTEVGYLAQIDHPRLGMLEWEAWEYPMGVLNDVSQDVGGHTLLNNFRISVGVVPDPDDDALDERSDEFRDSVAVLVDWFKERFEDPANRTSYESAEGGYLWNFGGPYDARDVLGDEFPDDERVLDAAVRQIERDGTYEWAPAPGYEDDPDEDDLDSFREDGEDDEAARLRRTDGDSEDDYGDEDIATPTTPQADLEQLLRVVRAVPSAGPGPRFEPTAGRIEFLGWTSGEDVPEPGALPLLPQIREAAQDLVDVLSGTNAHQQLFQEAERYLVTVNLTALTIEELYARGVRLENADYAVAAEIEAGNLPPLPSNANVALQALLHLHASAIMADPNGRKLAAGAREYRRPSGATADAQAAAKSFAKALGSAGDLVGPAAQQAVKEAAETLGTGPNPERSTQVSAGILAGLLRTFGAALKFLDSGMMGRFSWAVLSGTLAVSGVIDNATVALNQILSFLLEQAGNLVALAPILATQMPWLQGFIEGLGNLRRWLDARRGRH